MHGEAAMGNLALKEIRACDAPEGSIASLAEPVGVLDLAAA